MLTTRFGLVFGAAVILVHASGAPAAAQQAVTFTKDVAPILQKNCQQCHQPGAIGPMALTTFQEVRPWARAIKTKVVAGEMPPYRYDREVGIQKLKEDLRLSQDEIDTIARWVDSGSPQGNPADMPPPVKFADPSQWAFKDTLGEPDLIVRTKPFTLAANGQDVWWRPVVDTGLTEDRCIKAVSVRPSLKGRAAAHHANSELLMRDEKTGRVRRAGTALGVRARQDGRDRAAPIPAGRFRPAPRSGGTCTTTRPASSSRTM